MTSAPRPSPQLDLEQCVAQFSTRYDHIYPRVLALISLSVKYPVLGDIAHLFAIKIDRVHCRGRFLEVMEEVHQDSLEEFSAALFDKYGRLNFDVVDHEYMKGSGVWNGYCRIGRTPYFACAPNNTRPSRMLAASDDVPAHQYLGPPGPPSMSTASDKDLAAHYPVHVIIAASALSVVAQALGAAHRRISGAATVNEQVIGQLIFTGYENDAAAVRRRDEDGLSPLHLAAQLLHLRAINALLSLPRDTGVHEDLHTRENANGDSPLESCEHMVRDEGQLMETVWRKWDGYPEHALNVVLTLRRAAGERIEEKDEEYIRKRKRGCTCGQCVAGWLSPRIKCRLFVTAEMFHDVMDACKPTFVSRRPLDPKLCGWCSAVDYIPAHVWPGLYKSFYQAYRLVVIAVAHVLGKPGDRCLPLPRVVPSALLSGEVKHYADHWSQDRAQFFFDKGGRVEYALNYITDVALDQSPLGDGWSDEIREDDEEWNALPKCTNDLAFVMARQQLGLDPSQKWGPYYFPWDMTGEVHMDDDDDNDDMLE
ncbi:hypothetical protein CERSUDRAFT_100894 [Gelatoporia subvermispora B]|uniref:Uncharacterized protein n=1 Tax=Ceriporiopsis subvermispora (strain B) TaxID=914234 RepID=M2QFV2_CERS8|nr:hypothetical protein CERSUDRAFT_100894 [Gelatoporia subvermispora B]